MFVETNEQLEKLKAIGAIVADTLQYMISIAQPGMTTYELDQEGVK
jgi:methionine aminopeptidase